MVKGQELTQNDPSACPEPEMFNQKSYYKGMNS